MCRRSSDPLLGPCNEAATPDSRRATPAAVSAKWPGLDRRRRGSGGARVAARARGLGGRERESPAADLLPDLVGHRWSPRSPAALRRAVYSVFNNFEDQAYLTVHTLRRAQIQLHKFSKKKGKKKEKHVSHTRFFAFPSNSGLDLHFAPQILRVRAGLSHSAPVRGPFAPRPLDGFRDLKTNFLFFLLKFK